MTSHPLRLKVAVDVGAVEAETASDAEEWYGATLDKAVDGCHGDAEDRGNVLRAQEAAARRRRALQGVRHMSKLLKGSVGRREVAAWATALEGGNAAIVSNGAAALKECNSLNFYGSSSPDDCQSDEDCGKHKSLAGNAGLFVLLVILRAGYPQLWSAASDTAPSVALVSYIATAVGTRERRFVFSSPPPLK